MMCLMHLKDEVMQREQTCFLMQCVLVLMLFVTSPLVSYAQSDCFEYSADGKTITGLTGKGMAATSLTIPYEVTCVENNAFADANGGLTSLTIADGNPVFVSGFFGEHTSTLTYVDMGSGMSVANMKGLLGEISGVGKPLEDVVIEGYSGEPDTWTGEDWHDVDWSGVAKVTLPASLVADQTFGNAAVYGRFTINKEIVSFCGNATFQDVDYGSNWLFYVADRCGEGFVHIQRVKYIKAGAGILYHRTESTSGYVDLPRIVSIPNNATDHALYAQNMLKGVTVPTTIGRTDGDKTNLVLKDGAFHPTSGGTIGANKAYLQVPTGELAKGMLEISFGDDEATGLTPLSRCLDDSQPGVYDLQGRRVAMRRGLYLVNGKKIVMK